MKQRKTKTNKNGQPLGDRTKKHTTDKLQLENFDVLPDCAFVRLKTVCAILGVSPATVWRMSNDGTLPQPTIVNPKTTGWNVGKLRQSLKKILKG